jgi:hypothetical protein
VSRQYEIHTPDGKVLHVEGPDDATDEELVAFTRAQLGGKFGNNPVNVQNDPRRSPDAARSTVANLPAPQSDLLNIPLTGATLGFRDEINGVLGAGLDALVAPFSDKVDFSPTASYRAHRDYTRAEDATTRREYPWAAPAAEFAGGLLFGGRGATGALQGAGVSGTYTSRLAAGARTGAQLGAASGFGYGEGTANSVASAGLGGALGAGLGVALPVIGTALSRPVQAALNYLRPLPGIGRSLVGKALRDDAIPPSVAAQRLQAASGNGVPLALGDLGENLRGLTGATSRAPGPSRRLVRSMLQDRQDTQGERVRGALERDLGPVGNIDAIGEDISRRANAAAGPLYDAARAAPVISTPELQAVLATPAGRRAIAEARTIAANERRDPEALGFALDADNNVVLNPTLNIADDGSIVQEPARQQGYTLDTLDLVKRGLDAVLEPNRNPVTRRLDLSGNPLAQSQNTVRQQLLREVDRVNPAYAEARAAFADPARQRMALEQGGKMVDATAEAVERATTGLTNAQRAQYALGYRSKLAENLERAVMGGNKVARIVGTPRKQRALGQLFGDEPGFERFTNTLADEQLANETYRTVMTGSPTANRLADDAAIGDPSLAEDVAGKALKGAVNGGLTGMFINGLAAVGDRTRRFGAGATGNRAREEAAALLTETDPDLLVQRLAEGLRQAARMRIAARRFNRHVRAGTQYGARAIGAVSGYALRPADDQ